MLIFDQEIRCLEDFSLKVSGEDESTWLRLEDEDLVQEIKGVKKVSVALLEKDYNLLQSKECPYQGFDVYWQGRKIGKVVGYSGSSQLPLLEVEMKTKTLLLPQADEYLDSVEDGQLRVKNIQGLLEL